jgi:hypothetical protein
MPVNPNTGIGPKKDKELQSSGTAETKNPKQKKSDKKK